MSGIDVDKMSAIDIITLLNSGRYIPLHTKNQLQERLEIQRKTKIVSGIDEFFAMLGTGEKNNITKAVQPTKISEEFPEIKSEVPKSNKNKVLDFGCITNIKDEPNEEIESLIIDNKLLISFDDVLKMYNDAIIYRIKLQYLMLSRKIRIIESIKIIDQTKGEYLMEKFNHCDLCKNQFIMEKCIKFFIDMRNLINYLEYLIESLKLILNGNESINIKDVPYLENLFSDLFIKHSETFILLLAKISKESDSIKKIKSFNNSLINKRIEKCRNFITYIENITNNILNDFDPNISCEYFVTLKKCDHTNIILNGLNSNIYLDCRDEISLLCKHKNISDKTLMSINECELKDLFNKQKIFHSDHYLCIWNKIFREGKIYIHFDIKEKCVEQVSLKIIDLPPNTRIFSSIIKNPNVETNDEEIIFPITDDNYWLHKRNHLHNITEQEYNNLNPILKKYYNYHDTNKNIFTVDYLFNELKIQDKNKLLINNNMNNSFKNLAKNTSIII